MNNSKSKFQIDLGLSEFLPPLEQSLDLEFCLDQDSADYSHYSLLPYPPSSSILPHHGDLLDLTSCNTFTDLSAGLENGGEYSFYV